jgi:outer membrane protein assembly factor BamB
VKVMKRTKSPFSGNPLLVVTLTSLLILTACRLPNSSEAPTPALRLTPSAVNFPLRLRWQQRLDRSLVLPPQLWSETVIVPIDYSRNMSWLYALDIRSGDMLWQRGGSDLRVTNWPGSRLSAGGKLVVGVDEGVQALDLRTGETLWTAPSLMSVDNVAYGDGKVFVRVEWSIFSAYDLETGQMLWQRGVDQRSEIHYDAYNRTLVTVPVTFSGDYYWLDPDSGTVVRTKPVTVRPNVRTYAFVENGKLYDGAVVIDAMTGTPLCTHPESDGRLNPGDIFYDLLLIDDVLYISTFSSVVAFDTVACQPRWEYQPQGRLGRKRPEVVSNPAVLNGAVYAIFSDATLRAIDQQNGMEVGYWQADAVKYSFRDNSAIPGVVASNDMLIASFGNGQLYAFGP